MLLRDFVRTFRGLSGSAKAKAVCSRFPEVTHLSDFEKHEHLIAKLLETMRETVKPPSHNVLGLVGEEYYHRRFDEWYGVERFWYRKAKGELAGGLPYLFEVALAETEEIGDLFTAVNFSPTFEDPLSATKFTSPEFTAYGIRGFLNQGHALPGDNPWDMSLNYTAAAVHIVTPAPVFLDRGKTRLKLEDERG